VEEIEGRMRPFGLLWANVRINISKKILNDFVTIIQMSTSMWIYCTDRIIFWMSSANCMTHYSYSFDKINDTSLTMVYRYFFFLSILHIIFTDNESITTFLNFNFIYNCDVKPWPFFKYTMVWSSYNIFAIML
jgi:hypothetical protein